MTGRKMEFGSTAAAVAANLHRIRTSQNLLYTQVSARLKEIGREIPPLAVRRIEDGERQVTVDDLVALGAVLGVSPVALLMPASNERSDEVQTSATSQSITAERYWYWLVADSVLVECGDRRAPFEFQMRSLPPWEFVHMPKTLEADAHWIEIQQSRLEKGPTRPGESLGRTAAWFRAQVESQDDPKNESL